MRAALWSKEEDEIITQNYGKVAKAEMMQKVPNRAWRSIQTRANKIGASGLCARGKNRFLKCGNEVIIYLDRRDHSQLETRISLCDFDRVINRGKWMAMKRKNGSYYVSTANGYVLLHRFIMGVKRKLVDHRDNDGLNNVRSNLRKATKSENGQNQPVKNKNNKSSGIKNIYWNKCLRLWVVRIYCKGKKSFIKTSRSLEIAKQIADEMRPKMHPFFLK